MKTFFAILLTAAIAVPATWYFIRTETPPAAAPVTEKAAAYQCAMHPWIKSDKPGRCTICGMELTPIRAGHDDHALLDGLVSLSPDSVRILNVETSVARKQPLDRTLAVAGTIDDDATRHRLLSAYVDGRIEKLWVNHVGEEIAEGDPMLSFYSQMLLVAEGDYRLLEGKGKESAAIRLRQMGLGTRQIEAIPNKPLGTLTSDLDAPMTGTVVAQKVYEGQYVKQGDALFEIADFSTMWFMFDAYESDLPWLKEGQTVSLITASLPGTTLVGRIVFIDPNFNEMTRSTKVRVEIPNPLVDGKRRISHRISADGRVHLSVPDVLAIPRSAVLQTGPMALVYVDQGDGAYQRREIRIGRRGDQLVEVLDGLKGGEKVVTQGNLLIDGQAEINRSSVAEPATGSKPLTDLQRETVSRFVSLADAMALALSTDDLPAFNRASSTASDITEAFIATIKERPNPPPALMSLEQNKSFSNSPTLKEARQQFHGFITAAEVVLQPLRRTTNSPPFQVWECPMVGEAIPGSAPKGRWIQTGTRPNGNPFFGKAMPDCGDEIQP